ncbi:MAG: hypothetical protein JW730_02590 [Anaerolineales bacterium]|nr:hypothetical protein [Anaerolineales bacterium]
MNDESITVTLPAKVIVRIVQDHSLIEAHNIGRDTFYTSSLFWDCECEEHYIHPVYQDQCLLCGARREDQPDARVDEILNHTRGLPSDLLQVIEKLADQICPHLNAIPF